MRLPLSSAPLLAALLAGCGSETPAATPDAASAPDVAATPDAASTPDAMSTPDVTATPDAPSAPDATADGSATDVPAVPVLHGCTAAMYVDQTGGTANDRMIMTQGTSNAFDYPCMTIRAGQGVMFMWAFSRHPLAPGLAPGEAGMAPDMTPITPFNTGSVHTITFRTPGLYPFYCTAHPSTMKGVIQVL